MANIILIETSQTTCSVGLTTNSENDCIFKTETMPMQHATQLAPMIQEILSHAATRNIDINAVAVSGGPGSYTGLRIGVSTAKGLAYALNVPLIAIDTLKIMAFDIRQNLTTANTDNIRIRPMIDARRMEVYTALYDVNLNLIEEPQAKIIDSESLEYISEYKIAIGGSGAEKCKDVLNHTNIQWIDNINPSTQQMSTIAQQMFAEQQFVDVAYYEPYYLKEFQATTPKQKVL